MISAAVRYGVFSLCKGEKDVIKIIHAADLHLDSSFAALSAQQAQERRAHQRVLVQKIIEIGNEEQVDLILLAGDLFDGKNAYYETAEALTHAFSKSRARIFVAPGNHDPYSPASPYRSVHFSENVHLFREERMERVAVPELGCVVYGAAFTASACKTSLLSGFCAQDDALRIMVMHGDVGNAASPYNPILKEEIAQSNLHYLALGHVHASSGICRAGQTCYAYPGTPEGRGFDETGDKGILIGSISEENVDLSFRKISPYKYTERTIDAENIDLESIIAHLPRDSELEVCRMIFSGTCEALDLAALSEALSPRFYQLSLIDRTQPPRSVWDDLSEQSVKGMFLRRLRAAYESADEEERSTIELAAKYGVAALENREVVR